MANCECIPVNLCIDPAALPGGSGAGLQTWESDWFDIAASGIYTFTHGLGLAEPWKCLPRAVAQVKIAQAGWNVGDVIFADGSNYIGSTPGQEIGWCICVTENEVMITFGNAPNFAANNKPGGNGGLSKANVRCKLLISYYNSI